MIFFSLMLHFFVASLKFLCSLNATNLKFGVSCNSLTRLRCPRMSSPSLSDIIASSAERWRGAAGRLVVTQDAALVCGHVVTPRPSCLRRGCRPSPWRCVCVSLSRSWIVCLFLSPGPRREKKGPRVCEVSGGGGWTGGRGEKKEPFHLVE